MHLENVISKITEGKNYVFGIFKVTDEKNRIRSRNQIQSRIQIRIRKSEILIRGFASASVPKYHGFGTLLIRILNLTHSHFTCWHGQVKTQGCVQMLFTTQNCVFSKYTTCICVLQQIRFEFRILRLEHAKHRRNGSNMIVTVDHFCFLPNKRETRNIIENRRYAWLIKRPLHLFAVRYPGVIQAAKSVC